MVFNLPLNSAFAIQQEERHRELLQPSGRGASGTATWNLFYACFPPPLHVNLFFRLGAIRLRVGRVRPVPYSPDLAGYQGTPGFETN